MIGGLRVMGGIRSRLISPPVNFFVVSVLLVSPFFLYRPRDELRCPITRSFPDGILARVYHLANTFCTIAQAIISNRNRHTPASWM
jgi:hypothetical protein